MAGRLAAAVCFVALKGAKATPTPGPTVFQPTPEPTTVPTLVPTAEPTPAPTPVPTLTPTWSPELTAVVADWEQPCSLNLNVEECQNYASTEGYAFETRDSDSLPRGCWLQYPEENIFFNAHATWFANADALETWCDVTHDSVSTPCYVRMICRKEDWYVQPGFCQAGTGMNNEECRRIGGDHDVYAGGFATTSDRGLPAGCFGMGSKVMFNKHDKGGGHDKGYEAFCRKERNSCAGIADSFKRNRWCQKKCNKKRKRSCKASCPNKCIDTCKCNKRCKDSDTWYYLKETGQSWSIRRGCGWVGKDPDSRCKIRGSHRVLNEDNTWNYDNYGEEKQVAKAACPTACGKCPSRRLSASVLV